MGVHSGAGEAYLTTRLGIGQARPAAHRVAVNFERAGNRVIHIDADSLKPVERPGKDP